jgi:hypothetical protein
VDDLFSFLTVYEDAEAKVAKDKEMRANSLNMINQEIDSMFDTSGGTGAPRSPPPPPPSDNTDFLAKMLKSNPLISAEKVGGQLIWRALLHKMTVALCRRKGPRIAWKTLTKRNGAWKSLLPSICLYVARNV